MPTPDELRAAGWTQAADDSWLKSVSVRYKGKGKGYELHLFGDGVYLVDDNGGVLIDDAKAKRLLRKEAGGSPIERAFAAAWFMRHGAFPSSQVSIQKPDGSAYRVDFLLPGRLVVELDGHDWHSNRDQRTKDAKRDRTLLALGYRVIRFTGTEIDANADACVAEASALCK